MNYNKLKYFYEVARTLNQTKTAQDMYMSQSTLSKHIIDLEKDFDTALFIRTNRDLVLTPAGHILLNFCNTFFPKENEVYNSIKMATKAGKQPLRIAFMGLNTPLSEYKKKFSGVCPDIDLQFERINWDRILTSVHHEDVDAGIILSLDNIYPQNISYCTIDTKGIGVVMPTDHPFAALNSLRLDELHGETFLLEERDSSSTQYNSTFRFCEEAGFTPKIGGIFPNVETVLLMVQAGLGIALLSGFAPIQGVERIKCIPIDNSIDVFQNLIWKRGVINEPLQKFIEMLRTNNMVVR